MFDAERLADLRTTRNAIEDALGTGKDYVEMEIRGRRVRKAASVETLAYLNGQIERLERQQSYQHGPAKNRARIRRA